MFILHINTINIVKKKKYSSPKNSQALIQNLLPTHHATIDNKFYTRMSSFPYLTPKPPTKDMGTKYVSKKDVYRQNKVNSSKVNKGISQHRRGISSWSSRKIWGERYVHKEDLRVPLVCFPAYQVCIWERMCNQRPRQVSRHSWYACNKNYVFPDVLEYCNTIYHDQKWIWMIDPRQGNFVWDELHCNMESTQAWNCPAKVLLIGRGQQQKRRLCQEQLL